jgi:dTDP-4-dehydrorhamnose 3,5-epimerase
MSHCAVDIEGLIVRPLRKHSDARGWLCELYRDDELPEGLHAEMGYISETASGVTRGPHEHRQQTDCFCFLGPTNFLLCLWDNRPDSKTYRAQARLIVGRDRPALVIIPPGVVHAYRNIGVEPGIMLNFPNRLYRGEGRQEPVDEIRHEEDPLTPFVVAEEGADLPV